MAKPPTAARHPEGADAPIVLTPREFASLQGICAVAAWTLQHLRVSVAQQIAAAEAPQQQAFATLAKKYPRLRLDVPYRLDPAAHALVLDRPPVPPPPAVPAPRAGRHRSTTRRRG